MERQTTNAIMMIRPASFGYNSETSESNIFQKKDTTITPEEIRLKAQAEFDAAVETIKSHDIEVVVFNEEDGIKRPDAVFPNNWISLHEGKYLLTYPMLSARRRKERREDIIEYLEEERGYDKRYAFEYMEEDGLFLEGTGSMVLDRANRIAYAALSERTDIQVLDRFAVVMGYEKVIFHARIGGKEVYHTNVIMSVADNYCVVCLASIEDETERNELVRSLERTDKEIVEITEEQVYNFCGNVLQLKSRLGEKYLLMSANAYNSFEIGQLDSILRHNKIIQVDVPVIERFGGGSIRCMVAELN